MTFLLLVVQKEFNNLHLSASLNRKNDRRSKMWWENDADDCAIALKHVKYSLCFKIWSSKSYLYLSRMTMFKKTVASEIDLKRLLRPKLSEILVITAVFLQIITAWRNLRCNLLFQDTIQWFKYGTKNTAWTSTNSMKASTIHFRHN